MDVHPSYIASNVAGWAVQRPCGVETKPIAILKQICYCGSVLLRGA